MTIRSVLAGVAALAAVAAPAVGTAAPAPFAPTETLDPLTPLTPAVSIAGDGSAVAAWRVSVAGTTVLRTSVRPPGGAFGPITDITSAPGATPLTRSRVGLDGSGGGALVFHAREGSSTGPQLVRASIRSGGVFGTPVTLSPENVTTEGAELAVGRDGTAVAAWVRLASVETQFTTPDRVAVQVAVRNPGDTGFSAATDLATPLSGVRTPSVAVSPSGAAAVAYLRPETQPDGTTKTVVAVAYRAPGAAFGAPVTVSGDEPDAQFPRVAINAAGRATVVWSVHSVDGVYGAVIRTADIDATGTPVGPPATLSQPGPAFAAGSPRVAVNSSGDTAAMWTRRPTAGLLHDVVEAAVRPAGAAAFGAPITLTTTAVSSQEPIVAMSEDGTVLAHWVQRFGAEPDQLMSATLDPAAGAFSAPTSLGRAQVTTLDPSQLALGRDGSAVRVFPRILPGGGAPVLGVAVTQNPPAFVSPPVITGTLTVRSVLTCATPGLVGASSVSYEWFRGTRLVGTASTRTVVKGDRGRTLTCRVSALNPYGGAVATSAGLFIP